MKTQMETLTINVYEYDELNKEAQQRALDWYAEFALDYGWWDSTFEDAETIGLTIDTFDLERNRNATGRFTKDAETVATLICENHGKDCETFKTATAYLADITGHKDEEFLEEAANYFKRSLLEDYSIMLQHESDWLTSTEQVEESIRCNEYTFTETGKRMG